MFEESATEWPLLPLSEFIQRLDAGVSVNSEDRPHGAGEVGVLKTSALSGSSFNANENKAVLPSEQRLVAEPVSGDSILISRMNTPELVGVACYVRHPYSDLFLPDRIWQAKKKNRYDLDMRWLSYQLQTEGYRRFLGAHATGTSGSMKNLPKSSFLGMKLHFPKVDEQRLIAHILDTLDTQIQKTEALIAKLEKVKEALLHDLLTRGIDESGRLRPNPEQAPELYKESPLGFIPRGWDVTQVGEVGEVVTGSTPPSSDPKAWGGSLQFFTPGDVIDYAPLQSAERTISDSGTRHVRVIPPETILVVCIGSLGKVGITSCVGSTNQQINAIIPSPEWDPYYVFQAARYHVEQIHAWAGLQVVPIVNKSTFKKMLIPHPSAEEQIAISKSMRTFDYRIAKERCSIQKLSSEKAGLMDDLLTGRVRVTSLLDQAQATTPA